MDDYIPPEKKVIRRPKPPVEESQPEITINKSQIVQSLIDAHLIYTGRETDKQYEWPRGGSKVSVDERDVPELLSKRLGGTTCCGGSRDGNRIFEVVGD